MRTILFDRMERVEMKKSARIALLTSSRKKGKTRGDNAINTTATRESFGAKGSHNGSEQCSGKNFSTNEQRYRSFLSGTIARSTGYEKSCALSNCGNKAQSLAHQ